MMRYVGLKYVEIGGGGSDRIGSGEEDEFKDQPRLIIISPKNKTCFPMGQTGPVKLKYLDPL